jgi:enterochelin esterase-like enzyme
MVLERLAVDSELLGEPAEVVIAHPATAADESAPWVWLLHGYGNTISDVTWLLTGLDAAMAAGALAAHTIAAPVGPWSTTAWWVDSVARDGRPVQSAVVTEVLPQVEARRGGPAGREQRIVAGSSMGGAGAVNWLLDHEDVFGAAALAAPAAFSHAPPARATAYPSDAFGVGGQQYDAARWTSAMSYRQRLERRRPTAPAVRVATVVGDAEVVEDYPAPWGRSSLTLEAAKLHVALSDAPGITSSLRVIGAGHTWDFWIPALTLALQLVAGPVKSGAA